MASLGGHANHEVAVGPPPRTHTKRPSPTQGIELQKILQGMMDKQTTTLTGNFRAEVSTLNRRLD
eukprot:5228949-Karenia_brevis.AAC.1